MHFRDDAELARYVEGELAKGLPAGWHFRRERDQPGWSPAWRILPPGAVSWEDYILRVSGDRLLFVLYYDNDDIGGFQLHHVLMKAKVIDGQGLDHFPLAKVVASVVGHDPPNRWGLT